eukprot:1148393-Pelagomonas_calceolata.AAC.4
MRQWRVAWVPCPGLSCFRWMVLREGMWGPLLLWHEQSSPPGLYCLDVGVVQGTAWRALEPCKGVVVSKCYGVMVLRCYGVKVLWCQGAMVSTCRGAEVLFARDGAFNHVWVSPVCSPGSAGCGGWYQGVLTSRRYVEHRRHPFHPPVRLFTIWWLDKEPPCPATHHLLASMPGSRASVFEKRPSWGAFDNKLLRLVLRSAPRGNYSEASPEPIYDDNDAVLFEKIKKGNYDADDPIWEHISIGAKDAVARLLTVDTRKRLSATQALAHPWIDKGIRYPSQAPPPSSAGADG